MMTESTGYFRLSWLVPWFITRRFFAVRGVERSSSLAYITLLSLVPMLATLASLYRSFFSLQTERLVQLLRLLLPYSAGDPALVNEVELNLADFVNQANRIGGIGSLVFLVIALKLYLSIETTLNDVWSVTSKRTPALRMFSFTMVVFWGPVVIGAGTTALYWMDHQIWAPSSALLLMIGRVVLPLIGLTMVYWLAPHTGVSIRSAFIGGLTATLGFYGLRTGFVAYLKNFGDINVIYGSLGLVVIFLVSLFASWTLVIAGAVTSYVIQNLKAMVKEHDGGFGSQSDPIVTALAFLTECFRRRHLGEEAPTLTGVEMVLGITHPAAEQAAERLLEAGLVAVTGRSRDRYLPSDESARLTLAESVDRLRNGDEERPPGNTAAIASLAEQLGLANASRRQTLEQATFSDLLAAETVVASQEQEPPETKATDRKDTPDD